MNMSVFTIFVIFYIIVLKIDIVYRYSLETERWYFWRPLNLISP